MEDSAFDGLIWRYRIALAEIESIRIVVFDLIVYFAAVSG
jgi:hypothetical protein